jgi:hypothetical protein
MATSKPFDRYELRIHGSQAGAAGMLLCYNGTAFAGRIDFYPDGAALPKDYLWFGNSIVLHMPWSRFGDVLATVRTEKPTFLIISANPGPVVGATVEGTGYLATSASDREPVGEEEGAA